MKRPTSLFLPSRALKAAFALADAEADGLSVGGLARACGVTTSAVGFWMRRAGRVTDPAVIKAIRKAFRGAGVLIEYAPVSIDDVGAGATLIDGWRVRPLDEVRRPRPRGWRRLVPFRRPAS